MGLRICSHQARAWFRIDPICSVHFLKYTSLLDCSICKLYRDKCRVIFWHLCLVVIRPTLHSGTFSTGALIFLYFSTVGAVSYQLRNVFTANMARLDIQSVIPHNNAQSFMARRTASDFLAIAAVHLQAESQLTPAAKRVLAYCPTRRFTRCSVNFRQV